MDKSRLGHHNLLQKFVSLKSSIKKSLVEKRVSMADIIRVLTNVKAFHPSYSNKPLLDDCLADLKKAKNTRSLLASLPDDPSVLQYQIYEALASQLGTAKDQDLVCEYKAFLEGYGQRELVKCPRFSDVHQVPVIMSVSKELKQQTLQQFLHGFHSRMCENLLLNDYTLCLCEAKSSSHRGTECVQVTYQVPHFVKEAIFPLDKDQEEALRTAGVLEMNCESYQMRNPSSSTVSQKAASQSRSSAKHSSSKQSHKPAVTFSETIFPHRTPHTHHTSHIPHTSPLAQSISSPLNGNASMTASFPHMDMAHLGDGLATGFVTPTSLHGVGQNDVIMTSLEDVHTHFLANQLLAGASSSLPEQPRDSSHKSSDTSDNEDKSDQKPKPAPGKKTRGRVKIPMEYIKNKLRRYTTFSKRKSNIMKKAYELSTLTGTQVMLMVASETGHVYTFATPKLQPMITSEAGKALIQTCLHQPDPPQAPPTLPPEQFDVRMSSTGYEETELNNNYQMTDEDKLDNPTTTSMSLHNFPPLGLSLPADMSSLMPTLSSIQSLSGSTPGFLPPPLISPNLSPPDGSRGRGLNGREAMGDHDSTSQ